MRFRYRPLAALLLLAVFHGSVAAPWSAAPDIVPPDDTGMAHHGHDGMQGANPGGHPIDHSKSGCCDTSSCDCSCTATPAAALSPATAARDWQRAGTTRTPDAPGFRPATTGAPFRPPA